MNTVEFGGIGMTSQRTRERLIQRLKDQGISNQKVLDVIRVTPRHLFLDEALSHRAYEDTALPIGYGQTLSPALCRRVDDRNFVVSGTTQKSIRNRYRFWLSGNGFGSACRSGSTVLRELSHCRIKRGSASVSLVCVMSG